MTAWWASPTYKGWDSSVPRFQAMESGTLVPVRQSKLVNVASRGPIFGYVSTLADVREGPMPGMTPGASPVIIQKRNTQFL